MADNYFALVHNGFITEEHKEIPASVYEIKRSKQALIIMARKAELNPHEYSICSAFPKFEGAYYDLKDFEVDSEQGEPLYKFIK